MIPFMDISSTTIDAVYSGGVLRPLGEVKLAENERVRLTISPVPRQLSPEVLEWMKQAAALREELYAKYGYFGDSTQIIREMRDQDV